MRLPCPLTTQGGRFTKICLKRPCCLYFGQGSFKIESKELIHYVKEAEKEAFKTVE